MTATADSDQLELALFPTEPWGGRSPRVLTKGWKPLYLRPEPPGHEVFFDREQLELWPDNRPHRKKSLRSAAPGASLLLEPFRRTLKGVG